MTFCSQSEQKLRFEITRRPGQAAGGGGLQCVVMVSPSSGRSPSVSAQGREEGRKPGA